MVVSCRERKIGTKSKFYGNTGRLGWSPAGERISIRAFAAEITSVEQERLTLWIPVFFGAGIAAYFGLKVEPAPWMAALVAVIGVSVGVVGRRSLLVIVPAVAATSIALGFAAADWRASRVGAPVLSKDVRAVLVEGVLLHRTSRPDGAVRVVIAPSRVSRDLPGGTPARIRVNIRTTMDAVQPGDTVAVRAGLMPPPGPAAPGAFDFGRQAYFRQLGAVGYAVSPLTLLTPAPRTWAACVRHCVDRFRDELTQRIIAALPPPQGAIAAALMTGDRGGIPEEVLQDLRDTGLAHLLAISGLHMALFAGALFWGVRSVLALSPTLALRAPIKKWAAAAALVGALGYLLVSGASVATQRAFVMFTLIFVAVMLDRPAITMRNVALAAMIVMILTPEAVMEASFQMSFAAAIALVAFYEAARPWLSRWNSALADRGVISKAMLYLSGIALTSLVASAATAPFAAYHFNRVVDFGLVANLAAMPVVGIVVMPSALLAFIAMPFGVEALPLWVAGQGITMIIAVADTVAAWPGAITAIPALIPTALGLLVTGGLWMALWRSRMRWLGLLGPIVGIAIATTTPYPDILVDRQADIVAVRDEAGALVLSSGRKAGFVADSWLRRDADLRPQSDAALGGFVCDADGCINTHAKMGMLALPKNWRGVVEDCGEADILVTDMYAPIKCHASLVIDRGVLSRRGAHALYRTSSTGSPLRVVSACDVTGIRPWTRCRP